MDEFSEFKQEKNLKSQNLVLISQIEELNRRMAEAQYKHIQERNKYKNKFLGIAIWLFVGGVLFGFFVMPLLLP